MECVIANGCFDLLHDGHRHLLRACLERKPARLEVLVNDDFSTAMLKQQSLDSPRPCWKHHRRMLEIESFVLEVIREEPDRDMEMMCLGFDGDARQLYDRIYTAWRDGMRPVLVKGDEYREDQIPGAWLVRVLGGEVVRVPMLPGVSTTALLEEAARQ